MIGKLTGTLGDKNPPQVLVDCQGVGYEVTVPLGAVEHPQERPLQVLEFLMKGAANFSHQPNLPVM